MRPQTASAPGPVLRPRDNPRKRCKDKNHGSGTFRIAYHLRPPRLPEVPLRNCTQCVSRASRGEHVETVPARVEMGYVSRESLSIATAVLVEAQKLSPYHRSR